MRYANRQAAGKELAKALYHLRSTDAVVLALPRGGVVVGIEVARALRAPFGIVMVRKIAHPNYSEYAVGAIAEDGEPVYDAAERATLSDAWCTFAEAEARALIKYRHELYANNERTIPTITNKTVIIVDDGIATGLTMRAAVMYVRDKHPRRLIVAVPIASADSVLALRPIVDEVIVATDPHVFRGAVGAHYAHFPQVSDGEVKRLLNAFVSEPAT